MRSITLAAAAAFSILASSTGAVAQTAAPVSPSSASSVRAGADETGSALNGGSWLPPLLASLIVLGGILLATGVLFDDDNPTSP
jgi:hypothetical protein